MLFDPRKQEETAPLGHDHIGKQQGGGGFGGGVCEGVLKVREGLFGVVCGESAKAHALEEMEQQRKQIRIVFCDEDEPIRAERRAFFGWRVDC